MVERRALAALLLCAASAAQGAVGRAPALVPSRTVLAPALSASASGAAGLKLGAAAATSSPLPVLPGLSAPIPTSNLALGRMAASGAAPAAAAAAIAEASGPSDLAARLAKLGALTPAESSLESPGAEADLRTLGRRLWQEAVGFEHREIDRAWSVPAFVAKKDGIEYRIHPVAHGLVKPVGRPAVKALAREISASGGQLYSEQNLLPYYGVRGGREFVDQSAEPGKPAALREAKGVVNSALRAIYRLQEAAIAAGPAFGAAWAAAAGRPVLAVGLALAAPLLLFLYSRSFQPVTKTPFLDRALKLRKLGDEDAASLEEAEAQAFYSGQPDIDALDRLRPPVPVHGESPFTARSYAMADAASADASSRGVKKAHILAGYEHAHEIWERLAGGRTSV